MLRSDTLKTKALPKDKHMKIQGDHNPQTTKGWRTGGKPKKPTKEGVGAVLRRGKTKKIEENKRKPREQRRGEETSSSRRHSQREVEVTKTR
jgi:hypothetical protein